MRSSSPDDREYEGKLAKKKGRKEQKMLKHKGEREGYRSDSSGSPYSRDVTPQTEQKRKFDTSHERLESLERDSRRDMYESQDRNESPRDYRAKHYKGGMPDHQMISPAGKDRRGSFTPEQPPKSAEMIPRRDFSPSDSQRSGSPYHRGRHDVSPPGGDRRREIEDRYLFVNLNIRVLFSFHRWILFGCAVTIFQGNIFYVR